VRSQMRPIKLHFRKTFRTIRGQQLCCIHNHERLFSELSAAILVLLWNLDAANQSRDAQDSLERLLTLLALEMIVVRSNDSARVVLIAAVWAYPSELLTGDLAVSVAWHVPLNFSKAGLSDWPCLTGTRCLTEALNRSLDRRICRNERRETPPTDENR